MRFFFNLIHNPSSAEEEQDELLDDIAMPEGKVGAKKLAKLQAKAEKRANREVHFLAFTELSYLGHDMIENLIISIVTFIMMEFLSQFCLLIMI